MQPIAPGASEVRCPECGVLMHSAKPGIWRCPVRNCRGIMVFMRPDPEDEDYRSANEMFHDVSDKTGMVKRGGGDKAGRKRKKAKKRRDDEDPWRLK